MLFMLACSEQPAPPPPPTDAGELPIACSSPDDCAPLDAVCRQSVCQRDVPCGDDLECGLGERCEAGQCRFRGCATNADCDTGFCDATTFSCAECGSNDDCAGDKPICHRGLRRCVACAGDSDCQPPGQPHCSTSGACVACLTDSHCGQGFICSSGNLCVGASLNAPCPTGTACGAGLVCVNVGSTPTCLEACAVYEPACQPGQLCYGLSYSASTSLVFEASGPLGVCFSPQTGQRGLREPCVRTSTGNNCQPNLQCIPETATLALCRAYCDPLTSGACSAGEVCTRFVGDFAGREYGVCLPDTGFGTRCERDGTCRAGSSCQPWDDPQASDLVSGVCQFNLGDGGAVAPCAPQTSSDGGVIAANRQCRSAACVSDPFTPGEPYFCFTACERDDDCGDAGVCDGDFTLTTAYGISGQLRGCRPTCASAADCEGYDAGLTCRARVVSSANAPEFSSTCSPPAGSGEGGAPCSVDGECRSNYCVLDDSRGVRRTGACATFCADASECSGDAGTPIECVARVFLVSRGRDGVANSVDDVVATRRSCVGVTCMSDDGCDAGVCSLQRSPVDESALVQRCAPPTTGVKRGGEPCLTDVECRSGACGTLQSPSTGLGRACFEACASSATCAAGQTCRASVLLVAASLGAVAVDSCSP